MARGAGRPWRTVLATCAGLTALALGTGAVVVSTGAYDVRATTQHWQPVYGLLETAMRRSVQRQARRVAEPPLDDPGLRRRGAACFRAKCEPCHGGPGVAPQDIGLSMQPQPGPLVDAARRWRPRELYWITRHGIRMTGMPAWEARLDETERWAVVAFMTMLPELSPQDYRSRLAQAQGLDCGPPSRPDDSARHGRTTAAAAPTAARVPGPAAEAPPAGSARRGRFILTQYACGSCHIIPGIAGSRPQVGPPLDGMARRQLIAGQLPNTPDHMAAWLRNPHAVDPHTAMPDLGVTAEHARDMAAYLATLR
jgi:mono/diheme cytochrome c family protein